MSSKWSRLADTVGLEFVACIVSVYGVGQGFSNLLLDAARNYTLRDTLHLSAADAAMVTVVSRMPWSMKTLYGLLSDVRPINLRKRTPYMKLSAVAGALGWALMAAPGLQHTPLSAGLCIALGSLAVAVPDVMIDAAVAEASRAYQQQEINSTLQSICWGAWALFSIAAASASGFMVASIGARNMFWFLLLGACGVYIPAAARALGRFDYAPASSEAGIELRALRAAADAPDAPDAAPTSDHAALTKLAFAIAGAAVALGLGGALIALHSEHWAPRMTLSATVVVFVCATIYTMLRGIGDPAHGRALSRAALFIFLREATQPSLEAPMFYFLVDLGFTPQFMGMLTTVSLVAMLLGTIVYERYFATMKYRRVFALAQGLLVLCSLLDIVLVSGAATARGVPPRAFVLGDSLVSPVVGRLAMMPMFALASRVVPPGTEATTFALLMACSNFGSDVSSVFGSALYTLLDENLLLCSCIRTMARFIPFVLIYTLVTNQDELP